MVIFETKGLSEGVKRGHRSNNKKVTRNIGLENAKEESYKAEKQKIKSLLSIFFLPLLVNIEFTSTL